MANLTNKMLLMILRLNTIRIPDRNNLICPAEKAWCLSLFIQSGTVNRTHTRHIPLSSDRGHLLGPSSLQFNSKARTQLTANCHPCRMNEEKSNKKCRKHFVNCLRCWHRASDPKNTPGSHSTFVIHVAVMFVWCAWHDPQAFHSCPRRGNFIAWHFMAKRMFD